MRFQKRADTESVSDVAGFFNLRRIDNRKDDALKRPRAEGNFDRLALNNIEMVRYRVAEGAAMACWGIDRYLGELHLAEDLRSLCRSSRWPDWKATCFCGLP